MPAAQVQQRAAANDSAQASTPTTSRHTGQVLVRQTPPRYLGLSAARCTASSRSVRGREDLCLDAAAAIEDQLGIITPIDPR